MVTAMLMRQRDNLSEAAWKEWARKLSSKPCGTVSIFGVGDLRYNGLIIRDKETGNPIDLGWNTPNDEA